MFVVYGRGRKSLLFMGGAGKDICVQNIPSEPTACATFRLFLVIKSGQLLFIQGLVYLGMVVCF